jgi:chorismate dehydratase
MKVRLGRISYQNVMPVYWGLRRNIPPFLEMTVAPPSSLNRMLTAGFIDISPVSSISYAVNRKDWLIVPGLSISSRGPVRSVLLLSREPMKRLSGKRIVLSNESATSVTLLKLCLQREGVSPLFEQGEVNEETLRNPEVSGVLAIGDKALRWGRTERMAFRTDLGSYWDQWTGKPFVFALWAVRKPFAEKHADLVKQTIEALKSSRDRGLASLSAVSQQAAGEMGLPKPVMESYYKGLSYHLDDERKQGLRLFFHLSRQTAAVKEPVFLRYFTETG